MNNHEQLVGLAALVYCRCILFSETIVNISIQRFTFVFWGQKWWNFNFGNPYKKKTEIPWILLSKVAICDFRYYTVLGLNQRSPLTEVMLVKIFEDES